MVTVRKATLRDLDQMVKLRIEFYEDHLHYDPLLNPSSDPRVLRELKEEIKSYLSGDQGRKAAFVATDGLGFLGYINAEVKTQERIFKDRKGGHIPNIYVRPHMLRAKVGSALVQAAHHWLKSKGATIVRLVVYLDNTSGMAFWDKMGYKAYQQHMYSFLR